MRSEITRHGQTKSGLTSRTHRRSAAAALTPIGAVAASSAIVFQRSYSTELPIWASILTISATIGAQKSGTDSLLSRAADTRDGRRRGAVTLDGGCGGWPVGGSERRLQTFGAAAVGFARRFGSAAGFGLKCSALLIPPDQVRPAEGIWEPGFLAIQRLRGDPGDRRPLAAVGGDPAEHHVDRPHSPGSGPARSNGRVCRPLAAGR